MGQVVMSRARRDKHFSTFSEHRSKYHSIFRSLRISCHFSMLQLYIPSVVLSNKQNSYDKTAVSFHVAYVRSIFSEPTELFRHAIDSSGLSNITSHI